MALRTVVNSDGESALKPFTSTVPRIDSMKPVRSRSATKVAVCRALFIRTQIVNLQRQFHANGVIVVGLWRQKGLKTGASFPTSLVSANYLLKADLA